MAITPNIILVIFDEVFVIRDAFQLAGNVFVYEPLRVLARTIKSTKLRWKIPKNFPDER